MASNASYAPKKELPNLIPGSQSRPTDIFIPVWHDRMKTAFDITVVSPMQAALIEHSSAVPSAAIEAQKALKLGTHEDNCRAQHINFVPLIVETFGGWDAGAVKHLKEMASCAAQRLGNDPAIIKRQLFQYLSILLQRGNASLLINKDSFAPPHITGY
jgi:hypothetical protein